MCSCGSAVFLGYYGRRGEAHRRCSGTNPYTTRAELGPKPDEHCQVVHQPLAAELHDLRTRTALGSGSCEQV